MITIAILCVVLDYTGPTPEWEGMQCLPFVTIESCLKAERDLDITYVVESSCDDYVKPK